ncbi:hypothetical protein [Ktedonobacter racemifer]|uniref:Uncharacterized protein n=1 Tax=Ktedonobacter racemifer DSM 44963 TaxID=485913 RepID=D6TIT5_KTERA|nr:hypothetical protein [Ktedonobacter racemifer]EFH89342.1 hypothetical protein Krac_10892 [Ktedonobacter racemifer DSM 44963]
MRRGTRDVYKKEKPCKAGHVFTATMVPGWFQCTRSECSAVAVCPGCLGHASQGNAIYWCQAHRGHAVASS